MTPNKSIDFIVVGAGIAGLRGSIALSAYGNVLCLTKREVTESNTQYAQGGVAVVLSDEDTISLHYQDTIAAGDGLCNPAAVHVLVEEGPTRIEELIKWGAEFDRQGTKLAFTREAAHSRSRVLHAHGDSTGREIGRALLQRASAIKSITFQEFGFITDFCVEEGRVTGVKVLHENGTHDEYHAKAVLLASGGMGEVYANTTNPSVATADGVAMAFRAGAEISDMEFLQFHPTALYVKGAPRFLLSEALRGEGAYLRNSNLQRFMPKYHQMAELAPRDVVARAIAHELELCKLPEPVVFLDLTHLDGERLKLRFPRIYNTCLEYNIDITAEMVPIRPAAHYAMGGVRTDLDGRTSLDGLYAAGEAACTGVQGANRLASNSLLEGLVFGARAGAAMVADSPKSKPKTTAKSAAKSAPSRTAQDGGTPIVEAEVETIIKEAQQLMWQDVGIVRNGKGLQSAIARLGELQKKLPPPTSRRAWEARNILQAGLLIARSALAREESRGAHYRTDFPSHNDQKFLKHSVVEGTTIRFE